MKHERPVSGFSERRPVLSRSGGRSDFSSDGVEAFEQDLAV
jgi:hypothetical protein